MARLSAIELTSALFSAALKRPIGSSFLSLEKDWRVAKKPCIPLNPDGWTSTYERWCRPGLMSLRHIRIASSTWIAYGHDFAMERSNMPKILRSYDNGSAVVSLSGRIEVNDFPDLESSSVVQGT